MNETLALPYANQERKERINNSGGFYTSGILVSGEPFEIIKELDPNAVGGLIEVYFNDGSRIFNYSFFRPLRSLTHRLEEISFSKRFKKKGVVIMKRALVVDYTRKSASLIQENIRDVYKITGKCGTLYGIISTFIHKTAGMHTKRILDSLRRSDLLFDEPTNAERLERILEDLYFKGTDGIGNYEVMIQPHLEASDYFLFRKSLITRLAH